jgi:hypothetical protein
MRRPEVCKHQVCDHCGGRFGMVTHRWWGNKFCKRACKNAHRRENHHTQSGWVIPRSFTFAGGGACLAAAVAVVTLLLLASANAAPSEEQSAAGISLEFNREDGALYIDLSGPIVAGTADDVRAALGKHDTTLNRVVLFLDSAGGKVDDGDRVIEVLNEIKLRHQLITVVPHGKLCASMWPSYCPSIRVTKIFTLSGSNAHCGRAGDRKEHAIQGTDSVLAQAKHFGQGFSFEFRPKIGR